MKVLYITPIHQSFFIKSASSKLNYNKVASGLEDMCSGQVKIIVMHFREYIENINDVPQNSYLFYTVTRNSAYRSYLLDAILYLKDVRPDVNLIPSLDMFLSYGNKGYQELLRKKLKLGNLSGHYFGDITDLQDKHLVFPSVIKLPYGSGSRQVGLVNNLAEIRKFVDLHKGSVTSVKQLRFYLSRFVKSLYKGESDLENYNNHYYLNRTPFILQEYIPGLQHDFKVLVFGERYFVLKRYVRDNDFRASGSGKFHFETPDEALLNYAKEVFEKLDVPFISLDIAQDDKKCYLIELQGIGFGMPTLTRSNGYYTYDSHANRWVFVEGKSEVEANYSQALFNYIGVDENI
ncbi:ATP-grasp domain-containing protein [Pedobacter deserti]|uniref:ATP-grasp domain-containing protein n=1 Tax=Pedobacter deserti TaxID=2817382 RepID=UPI00210AA619|nr:hypothetical protein [Pedobacter sp. SYSU D00382]